MLPYQYGILMPRKAPRSHDVAPDGMPCDAGSPEGLPFRATAKPRTQVEAPASGAIIRRRRTTARPLLCGPLWLLVQICPGVPSHGALAQDALCDMKVRMDCYSKPAQSFT